MEPRPPRSGGFNASENFSRERGPGEVSVQGPVKYEYYKLLAEGSATEATQILKIVSYSVKPFDH